MNSKEKIYEIYQKFCETPSDINEHLPTLKKYADMCDVVIEFGVRGIVSTWPFLASSAKIIRSVDIRHPDTFSDEMQTKGVHVYGLKDVEKLAKEAEKDFSFTEANTLNLQISDNFADLLFIDTLHQYEQLKQELSIHGNKIKKYLMFHDTGPDPGYGFRDEGLDGIPLEDKPGLNKAIFEFVGNNPHWSVKETYMNNNGLTVLSREIV